jgi:hypothetical protein
MTSFLLIALLNLNDPPTFEFLDSRDDPKATYLIVNGTCKIKILKKDLDKTDEIVDIVEKTCDMPSLSY